MSITDALLQADQNKLATFRSVLADAPIPGDVQDDEVALLSSGLPVALFNPATKKADRVGAKRLDDGRKVRVFKANGEQVDV